MTEGAGALTWPPAALMRAQGARVQAPHVCSLPGLRHAEGMGPPRAGVAAVWLWSRDWAMLRRRQRSAEPCILL
jgi:hypothetical protein